MTRPNATRPNVIVVLTDQQRWDTTGIHGNPLDLTPNFDRLAVRGTHVRQAFTAQPVCAPARAALQTGQYATRTGVFRNDVALREESRTLAHCFGEAGYATGYIGKWHLARTDGPVPEERRGGYGFWLGSNLLEFTSDAYRTVLFDQAGDPVALPGYRSDALIDAAIRFIADSQDQPFYLFLSHLEPHHQNELDNHPAPEGYEERYQGRWMPPDLAALPGTAHRHMGGYLGQVKRLDEGLGRLLDALRSLDIAENTIVAWTSDHGNHFRSRNGEYKRSCHDASLRVPLALCGPGFAGGGSVPGPISTVDLAPTLLDAAGIDIPEAMQGRSFLPLLGPASRAPWDWQAEIFFQVSETTVGRGVRTDRWKYFAVAPGADPWNDAAAGHYREDALYDLLSDPHELVNLAGSPTHAGVAAELRERLIVRMVEAGEAAPVIEPAEPNSAMPQRSVDPQVHTSGRRPTRFGHQPRGEP